jgi:hypothetical protein
MKSGTSKFLLFTACLWLMPELRAQTNTNNVVVAFSTTNTTPLNLGFGGFSMEILNGGLEYDNPTLRQMAATLSPGWLRFPGGISDDAFNWQTGLTDTNWINTMIANGETSAAQSCQFTVQPLLGKGGAQFTNFANFAANVGGARLIVVVNCFTDTSASAGAFAAYALSNHIAVAAWELCNEPYNFTGANDFWTNGTDYLNKMLPYRNAIKAADSNAQVAIFYNNPGSDGPIWDKAMTNYPNKFWDMVSYHYYPAYPGYTNFNDLMTYDNGLLFSNTTAYVTNSLIPGNSNSVNFMITEFQPVQGSGAGTGNQSPNPPSMTLYAGIYASELVMRMSTISRMKFVGTYQIANGNGINQTNVERLAVTTAAAGGYYTNTANLPFGLYYSAQVCGQGVSYWAINRSTALFPTTVGANGPTVPISLDGAVTMPAVYAQAYQGDNGKRYVVFTNKGSNAVPVQITQDGAALTNEFLETFVTGGDPGMTNSSPVDSPVQIQTLVGVTNPVTIPQYSVVRLEWTVFNVPKPALRLASADPARALQWTGLTNVVYNVQGAANVLGPWTTLGRVASTETNFSFTDYPTGAEEYYRLVVP